MQGPSESSSEQPETAPEGTPAAGFPEIPGSNPGDQARPRSPYSQLNVPVGEPDPTEWPDPYDRREDPKAPAEEMVFPGDGRIHTPVGATSTSDPKDDIEAIKTKAPERDNLDE